MNKWAKKGRLKVINFLISLQSFLVRYFNWKNMVLFNPAIMKNKIPSEFKISDSRIEIPAPSNPIFN